MHYIIDLYYNFLDKFDGIFNTTNKKILGLFFILGLFIIFIFSSYSEQKEIIRQPIISSEIQQPQWEETTQIIQPTIEEKLVTALQNLDITDANTSVGIKMLYFMALTSGIDMKSILTNEELEEISDLLNLSDTNSQGQSIVSQNNEEEEQYREFYEIVENKYNIEKPTIQLSNILSNVQSKLENYPEKDIAYIMLRNTFRDKEFSKTILSQEIRKVVSRLNIMTIEHIETFNNIVEISKKLIQYKKTLTIDSYNNTVALEEINYLMSQRMDYLLSSYNLIDENRNTVKSLKPLKKLELVSSL